MHGWWSWALGSAVAGAAYAGPLAAQAAVDVCALATSQEFQEAQGIDPRIGVLPDEPVATEMVWGPHCDYAVGSIDLFTKKSPTAELERVLTLTKSEKRRDPVSGLGQKAFFTVTYPGDQYRERGLLAVYRGDKVIVLTMDILHGESGWANRPKLEKLAKLVLPRVK